MWQQLLLKGTQNKIINYGVTETRCFLCYSIHLQQKVPRSPPVAMKMELRKEYYKKADTCVTCEMKISLEPPAAQLLMKTKLLEVLVSVTHRNSHTKRASCLSIFCQLQTTFPTQRKQKPVTFIH